MKVFQLLVYAIVAAALLWFFFAYLEPYFNPPSNAIEKIETGLQAAKLLPGQVIPLGILSFSEKTNLSKGLFSETGTDTILECNSPAFCCDKGITCGGKAVWTEENISFSQKQAMPAFVRCKTEYGFFACKVFAGEQPAQVRIKKLNSEKQLDLQAKNQWIITVEIQNTGKLVSLPGNAVLTMEKKLENGSKTTIGSLEKQFFGIEAGQSQSVEIAFPVSENGSYEALLRLESDNAGYEEITLEFAAINQPSPCRALNQQARTKEFDSQTSECIEKFPCAECISSTECKQEWQEIFPEKEFEIGDSGFVQTRTAGTAENCV